ncbi:MAG: saccharopine dehydrogenase NADP-binding domain-containing protein [Anaerolineae bacterium]|nr:saccharopine dehydrogenase NADP-binding domain-containing protein [Anaerolineae bacterium]
MKRVLILGAGLVTGPMVHYLLDKGYHVTVASRTVAKAQALIGAHPNAEAIAYDIESDPGGATLAKLVGQADLAVSMLPYIHHPAVAKACIAQGKHMVTTSYVSPAMRELDAAAKEAGIVILNEVGVDPGIDHMSAMQIIHKVQQAGGHIDGFMSYCGGLPAPEANDNPFGYKFSWSPRGVLLAARNAAHYQRDGQEVNVPGQELFTHYWLLDVEGLGQFEAYPNRDSLPYREAYGIGDAATMYRGTLRNGGWCDVLYKIAALGFLDDRPYDVTGKTYAHFMRGLLPPEITQTNNVKADVAAQLGVEPDSAVIKNLDWLGLFDDRPIEAPGGKISPLDLLTRVMLERMQYAEGERDLIILVHHFDASYPGGKKEKISSTLIAFGEPGGDTAMARTVSLPAAIGVDLILSGQVSATGIQTPLTPMWYEPILAGLKDRGIECVERVEEG